MDGVALDQLHISMGDGSELIMSFVLALMMFAVALGLRPQNFAFFKTDPKHYFAGVLAQILGLPLLTLLLVMILKPWPSLAFGMILVACCPGGNISNLLVMFARGNTALSVSMTATSSLLAAILTPISIVFWSGLYGPTRDLLNSIDFDSFGFLIQTFLILGVPIALGMLTVWRYPNMAAKAQKPLGLIAALLLFIIIIAAFYKYKDVLSNYGMVILPLVIVHNALALGLGYVSARLTKADSPTRRAMTFEVGIQNSGLGFVILITQLSGLGGAAAIAGMWGLWHIVAGLTVVGVFRLSDRRKGTAYV